MKKTYVLDTNVLLYDANALDNFEDNDVVLPITVIEEIDKFKKGLNGLGRNARTVSRHLDELRLHHKPGVTEGIPLGANGARLFFALGDGQPEPLPYGFSQEPADNRILSLLREIGARAKAQPVILVTRDTNMRIKANALGFPAEDYEHDRVEVEELYTGLRRIEVDAEAVDALYEKGSLDLPELGLRPFEFVHLIDRVNPKHAGIGLQDPERKAVTALAQKPPRAWGILPRNLEQRCALEVLLDERVKLVTLAGKAGTGKTLLAVACGLQKVSEEGAYGRLLISRPIFPMGKDIGFLPGDVQEKLDPWMQPIYDNLELLMGAGPGRGNRAKGYAQLIDLGVLQVEPLTYIRGRSIPNQYIIVDEAQNLTPHEIKTILTRSGEGTKVVLTGDLYQIDNPFVDTSSNGLSYTVERLKDEVLTSHVTLVKGERSPLAELAANKL